MGNRDDDVDCRCGPLVLVRVPQEFRQTGGERLLERLFHPNAAFAKFPLVDTQGKHPIEWKAVLAAMAATVRRVKIRPDRRSTTQTGPFNGTRQQLATIPTESRGAVSPAISGNKAFLLCRKRLPAPHTGPRIDKINRIAAESPPGITDR